MSLRRTSRKAGEATGLVRESVVRACEVRAKGCEIPRCTSEAGLVAAYTPIPIHGPQTLTPALIQPPQVTSSSLCYFGNSSYLAHRFPELQKTTLTGFLLLPHVPLSGAYLFEDLPGTRMRRDARRGGAHRCPQRPAGPGSNQSI